MANTEELKNAIQKQLEEDALTKNEKISKLSEKDRENFEKYVLCGVKPDFLLMINNTLVIGEITVSGFMHKKFHLGISKKVTEAFSKFSLIRSRFQNHQNLFSFNSIRCLFIVPTLEKEETSLDHIGWRESLFSLGVMSLEKIDISNNSTFKNAITSSLEKSINEQKSK